MDKQHFRIDRKHARINTDIPGEVGLQDDDQYDVTVLNLSIDGLKLACNNDTFAAIIPPGQRTPGQVIDVHVDVKFTLRPANQHAITIQADAMLVYSERLAQDSYHVGFRFVGMSKSVVNKLETYIEEILATQEAG